MKTPLILGLFAAGLAVAFGAAFALGSAVAPVSSDVNPSPETAERSEHSERGDREHGEGGEGRPRSATSATLPGLAVSEAGYTFAPRTTTVSRDAPASFQFTITGPDGRPVTSYQKSHEKELHLIVVRRDLTGFQHLHPTRSADGTWSTALDLPEAGVYRAFADFTPSSLGREITLGTDLFVAGDFASTAPPPPNSTDEVDGYMVALAGNPSPGRAADLTFTITKDGQPVADLEPYLGAFGHLVSLREGDLAYLHTHPDEDARSGARGGPAVRFATEFPTAGRYRLFLDFQVEGTVRTAEFTVAVGSAGTTDEPSPTSDGSTGTGHNH